MNGLKRTVLALVVITAAMGFAFRLELAGSALFWVALGVPYLLLAALSLHKLWNEGALSDVLGPRWGDFSLGFLTAALLLLASWGARAVLAPAGSTRLGWLFRIYAQVGDPDVVQRSFIYSGALLVIVVCEELVWRSMVLDELTQRFGTRRAWPIAALCYGVTALPTLYTLRDEAAGYNPLLVTAALGCGIVWSFLAMLKGGRLLPVIIAHGVFTYFSLVQFRWPWG
ncbi:MAG TPA: CPBP family intramembrane glutamic endopeptidase [Polyangiaceae bacterium]|nr:CPBP family intramembrane glutamic endopeptidase [Polyangiaceae bacterium]